MEEVFCMELFQNFGLKKCPVFTQFTLAPTSHVNVTRITKPANLLDTRGNITQKSGKFKYFQIVLSIEGISFSFFHIPDKPK
jgi:hypothetical protein